MIVTLSHSIEIDAPPESVYGFFLDIEENYTKWHPDHVVFRWIEGGSLAKGAVAYSEQYIHGKLHRLKARFTKVVPYREIEFSWVNPLIRFFAPRNTWVFEPAGGGCRFTAEGDLRLGWISSRMGRVKQRLEEGRRHIEEEGENLKRLVEAGVAPSP
ncbi:MAG: SRPBCC family protein [Candidatus Eisenbacteria bacterium]